VAIPSLPSRTFRESHRELIPEAQCRASHHRSASRFIWPDELLGVDHDGAARRAARARRLVSSFQPGPPSFQAYRLEDEGLRPVLLQYEGQDFRSSATAWEKAHADLLGDGWPRPVVDEDGTVIGYFRRESSDGVKKMWLYAIDGTTQVYWMDERGLGDSVGNELLLIVITLGAGLARGLLKLALERIVLRMAARELEEEMVVGLYHKVARSVLQEAMAAPGPRVRLVTGLSRPPVAGLPLSAGTGDAAVAIAKSAGADRRLFAADVPDVLLVRMEHAGLVIAKKANMGGVEGFELRFQANATEFIAEFFRPFSP
jgi:hypothetical protein